MTSSLRTVLGPSTESPERQLRSIACPLVGSSEDVTAITIQPAGADASSGLIWSARSGHGLMIVRIKRKDLLSFQPPIPFYL